MQVVAVGRHEPDWMKNTGVSFVKAGVTQPESFAALPQQDVFAVLNFAGVPPNIYLYDPAEYYYVDGVARPIAYRYMIRRAMAGEPLELWGDPNKGIDLVYVKDLCRLVECTLRCDKQSGRYNAGIGKLSTMEEYLRGIIRVFSPADKPSELVYRPAKPDCANFMMDITNAREELGYEPQYDCLAFLEDYKREMEKDQKK